MYKVILVHANCHNPTAKGDFAFAGNIAIDLIHELRMRGMIDIDVFLVSRFDGVSRFASMYGPVISGRIKIQDVSIGLSSLEEFDAVENTVVAFIDANRCKHSPADLIKRVLSPESKFIFIGNANKYVFSDLFSQTLYLMQIKHEQPGIYESFDDKDVFIGSAGLGQERIGLPTIIKSENLPKLSISEQEIIPSDEYGFMYIAAVDSSRDYKLIAQYIKLSNQKKYILVGDFIGKKLEIQNAYEHKTTLVTSKTLPRIEYYQSLPNRVMRHAAACSTSSLILSTGVTSTLEAMQDSKLPYYQYMSVNTEFIAAYLIAVKSLISSDDSLCGAMPRMIIDLSELLFAKKPLSQKEAQQASELLTISSVSSRLVSTNHTIIEQASGKISTKLLAFLGESRKTQDQIQLANVCASLRKKNEIGSPIHVQALRRAAAWGRLFELKVLIKSMPQIELNKADSTYGHTALHWAVSNKNFDCVRELIKAGVSIDVQDKQGKTPLHRAVVNSDRAMIKLLIEAGASVDVYDKNQSTPQDYAPDSGILLFIKDCHTHLHTYGSSFE